jgi:hypothetical protein
MPKSQGSWQGLLLCGVQNETTRELRELNKVDTMLYNELTACPNGIDFPEFDRSKFKQ